MHPSARLQYGRARWLGAIRVSVAVCPLFYKRVARRAVSAQQTLARKNVHPFIFVQGTTNVAHIAEVSYTVVFKYMKNIYAKFHHNPIIFI